MSGETPMESGFKDYVAEIAQRVISTEIEAAQVLLGRIDSHFAKACELILSCKGRVVWIGIGKSGLIAQKLSATIASLGIPSFFLHAGEAVHGDLGRLSQNDVAVIISQSGETDEILISLPYLKLLGVPLIAFTGSANSTIASAATVNIDVSVSTESCALGIAPTSSSTVTLIAGHAISVVCSTLRQFASEEFARLHPAGALGRKLNLKVGDLMLSGESIPIVKEGFLLTDTIYEMTSKRQGFVIVVNKKTELIGIITDGDLRRIFGERIDLGSVKVEQLMTKHPLTISENDTVMSATSLMRERKINVLIVVDKQIAPIGAITLHDVVEGQRAFK